ncbi:MAG: hypothetical protein SA339_05040 [Methanomassiliicoccus sp.]|nr:hypothetical protein [Methanomassiliicoccus sp.]
MGQIRTADVIQKLHFDRELLEPGLLQSMYQDTKVFLQFTDLVENQLKIRHAKLEQTVEAFQVHAGRLAETREGKHYLDIDGPVDEVCRVALQFSKSLRAQDLIERNEQAQTDLEMHRVFIETHGLKGGLDEVRKIYSDDPTLFALMLSSATSLASKKEAQNSLSPPR